MNERKPQPPTQSGSSESHGAFRLLEPGTNRRLILLGVCVLVGLVLATLMILSRWQERRNNRLTGYSNYLYFPTAEAAEVDPWDRAVEKAREDRGEPMGREAPVEIPPQIRHYSDTRRFLATQTAEVREHGFATPRDMVDLAALVQTGEMVPLESVTSDYVLMGVGGTADTGPFTIYRGSKRVPVLNHAGLEKEKARLDATANDLKTDIAELRKELNGVGKRERTRRKQLQSQISTLTDKANEIREDLELLEQHYRSVEQRAKMLAAYHALENLANTFGDHKYNLENPSDRRAMKRRMLRSLRPEAIKVLQEIARPYHEKFDRPLPITSLVRPEEYQHLLAKVNPNATLIEVPPHSTGLAFDVSYRYMTSAEQSHLMEHLAELKDAGRIEVLRETRNHYHIFAFVDGARPRESLIAASLGSVGSRRAPQRQLTSHHAKKIRKVKRPRR